MQIRTTTHVWSAQGALMDSVLTALLIVAVLSLVAGSENKKKICVPAPPTRASEEQGRKTLKHTARVSASCRSALYREHRVGRFNYSYSPGE